MPPPRPLNALSVPDIRDVPVYIYGLADPVTGEIRYIGKSSNPEGRLASHVSNQSGARRVRAWLASLSGPPTIVIIRTVAPGNDAALAEREEILLRVAAGARLVNRQGIGSSITIEQLKEQAQSTALRQVYKRNWPETRAVQALSNMLSVCTQKDIERLIGGSQGHISRLLSGQKPSSLKVANRFRRIGIELDWWDIPPVKSEAA